MRVEFFLGGGVIKPTFYPKRSVCSYSATFHSFMSMYVYAID